jgi:membrane protease YdiL (CAAX protease family)
MSIITIHIDGHPYQEGSPLRNFGQLAAWGTLATTGGFFEELIFRGSLMQQFRAWTESIVWAVVIQGILFGLAHGFYGIGHGYGRSSRMSAGIACRMESSSIPQPRCLKTVADHSSRGLADRYRKAETNHPVRSSKDAFRNSASELFIILSAASMVLG